VSVTVTRNWKGTPIHWLRWPMIASDWVKVATPIAEEAVKTEAPVYHGHSIRTPGKLKQSIAAVPYVSQNSATINIGTTVPYARFVIDGAAPHIIEPRKANILGWQDVDGFRFSTKVHHPGQRANRFPERGLEIVEPLLMDLFSEIVRKSFVVTAEKG